MADKHGFQQYAILWAIAIALFMMNVDVTIISTAIPKMAASLINQVGAFQWTFIMVGLLTLAASLVFMRLHKGDGQGL